MRFSSRRDISPSQSTASIELRNELTAGRESETALCRAPADTGREGFVFLRAGKDCRRAKQANCGNQPAHNFPLRLLTISACGHSVASASSPALVFNLAFFQPALTNHYPVRDADQFHVSKHDARALVAVIEDDIDAGHFQFGVKLVGGDLDASLL
jgi:hypothetical protein